MFCDDPPKPLLSGTWYKKRFLSLAISSFTNHIEMNLFGFSHASFDQINHPRGAFGIFGASVWGGVQGKISVISIFLKNSM